MVGGNPGTQAKPHFHTAGELPHLSVGFTASLTFLLQQSVPKPSLLSQVGGGAYLAVRAEVAVPACWGCGRDGAGQYPFLYYCHPPARVILQPAVWPTSS